MIFYDIKLKSNKIAAKSFKAFIIARNYKNAHNYLTPILSFLSWVEAQNIDHLNHITHLDINKYLNYLSCRPNHRSDGALSESSVRGHILALNLFFGMLLDANVVDHVYVLPSFNLSDRQPRNIVTIEEIKEMKRFCENQRELSIINLAYGCGLRRAELVRLNTNDLLLSRGCLIVRLVKNSKRREIPITNTILHELKEYLIDFRPQTLNPKSILEKAFFTNINGQRMTGNMLNNTLKNIISRTANTELINKNITLHCLRHSIATHLQEAGANVEFVRDFLGHTEIDTTMLYMIRRKRKIII